MSFVDFVVEVHSTLTDAGLAHAFGGALALAYVAEPRGTVDVDVNVFTPIDDVDAVLEVFATIDLRPEQTLRSIASARGDLDIDYVERQATGLRGPSMYPRVARLRRILREAHGGSGP